MATYINKGGEVVFPTLFDADGNVLLVRNGATFTGPDGITVDGIEIVPAKGKAAPVVEAPVEEIPAEPVIDLAPEEAPVESETV